MDLSVVLCTYNNSGRLEVTLQSFCRLSLPESIEWELVVVNNNSTDNTDKIVKQFDDRLPLKYEYEPRQGKSRALNKGISIARGDLIIFTDDDVELSSEWLIAYWQVHNEKPADYYFGGPIKSKYQGEQPSHELLRVAQPSVAGLNYGSIAKEVSPPAFVGANWACRSEHLTQVGGFDEDLGLGSAETLRVGEETDIMTRLAKNGITPYYIPKARVKHFVPTQKCTLDHVAERHAALNSGSYSKGSEMPTTFMGLPLGLYKTTFIYCLRWVKNMIIGKRWRKDYIEYRKMKKLVSEYHK